MSSGPPPSPPCPQPVSEDCLFHFPAGLVRPQVAKAKAHRRIHCVHVAAELVASAPGTTEAVKTISTEGYDAFIEANSQNKLLVVDYYTDWCEAGRLAGLLSHHLSSNGLALAALSLGWSSSPDAAGSHREGSRVHYRTTPRGAPLLPCPLPHKPLPPTPPHPTLLL